MNAPQTRQRPAGTGREVEQQIDLARQLYSGGERSARAGYKGTGPRSIAADPRHFATIALDLAGAATRLRAIAGGIRLGGPTADAITQADCIVTGCGSLLRELRQAVKP
jgi:hypothetical protein